MKKLPEICFLTSDDLESSKLIDIVSLLLESGIRWIQYRDKKNIKKIIYQNAINLKQLTSKFDALLSINDYLDIALAVNADGVHLGQDDLPLKEAKKIANNMIIGISTHNLGQAREAENNGADYIGFGPIFHTTTKDAGEPKGVSALREVKEFINIPTIAIGGINITNLMSVIQSGADGVAISSGLLMGNIKDNFHKFKEIIERLQRGQ